MSRYIKKTESNIGPFQVRIEPNAYVKGEVAWNVDITEDPQPFEDGVAEYLINAYSRQVEEVSLEDVPLEFLSAEDVPPPPDERFACEVEDCGKDYVSQANLDKHAKGVHGNLLERLVTAKVTEAELVASE